MLHYNPSLNSNHTCLLLTPLLSSLVIWLPEKLFGLKKNPLLIFCCFPGFSSTYAYYMCVPWSWFPLRSCCCRRVEALLALGVEGATACADAAVTPDGLCGGNTVAG